MARSTQRDRSPKIWQSRGFRLGLLFVGTVAVAIAIAWINWEALFEPLNQFVYALDERYYAWMGDRAGGSPLLLLLLAFGGGLMASISPCVLGLLPINLSYIGTRDITSRWDALLKASAFVLGVITTYSLLGLFSSFAAWVMVDYRGYIQLAVGAVVIVMGLALLDFIRLPLPQFDLTLPAAGPYGVGLTFALVSSPCSSPVMFAVLAMAAEQGSPLYSTLTMVSYALGYSMVIFLASLFAGIVKQTRGLLQHSPAIARISSIILIVLGGYYLIDGASWAIALLGNS